jgi:hypothetical protein
VAERNKKMKPGERRHKTLEDCLRDLKAAIERGAKRYRRTRDRIHA